MVTVYGSGVAIVHTKAFVHRNSLPRTWRYTIALALHAIALLVLLGTIMLNRWITGVAVGQRVNIGLWTACIEGVCVSMLTDDADILNVLGNGVIWAEVLTVGAAVLLGLAFIFALIILMSSSIPIKNLEGQTAIVFLAGTLVLVGTAVYHFKVYMPLTQHSDGTLVPTYLWSNLLSAFLAITTAVGYGAEHRYYTFIATSLTDERIPLTRGL